MASVNFSIIRDRNWTSPVLRFLWRCRLRLRVWTISRKVEWIQRGNEVSLGETDAVVYTTFRNGALYLDDFIRHYQRLGVSKVVLIDNGSTDESVEIISRYPEVGLMRCALPYRKYHVAFRHYFLLTQVGRGWGINIDIDELLDFPGSSAISLNQFLAYLNEHQYTAVQGYMLDRFSKAPVGKAGSRPGDDLSQTCPYYSLDDVESLPYADGAIGPKGSKGNTEIFDLRGGVRLRFCNLYTYLSKFPLVRRNRGQVANVHRVFNAHRADVSVVLNHYRFLDDVEDAAKNFKQQSQGRYDGLLELFNEEADAVVYQEGDKVWRGVDKLVDEGFLKTSEQYVAWINDRSEN